MARKKSKKKKEIEGGDDCQHCGAFVLYNAPMSGIIADVGDRQMIICVNCSQQLLAVQRYMAQRWG